MSFSRHGAVGVLLVLAMTAVALAAPDKTDKPDKPVFKKYDAKFYTIYTDLDEAMVCETVKRAIAMVEEYAVRCRGFAGSNIGKMPLRMFSSTDDYRAAKGMGAGQYNGKELMVNASKDIGDQVWHVMQHEGFHQFASKMISPRLPIWVNEGMAEYFGEGIWTGDGMVCGLLPPARVKLVQDAITNKKLMDFDKMVAFSHAEWNANLRYENYTQAWSMIHFLAHADGGKYQPALVGFLKDVDGGTQPKVSWARRFGNDQGAFEKKYCDWWMNLQPDSTQDLYTQVTVQTLTSYLARATSLKQKYEDADSFFAACKDGKLEMDPKKNGAIWLPKTLLDRELAKAEKLKTWSLVYQTKTAPPKLRLTLEDGTTFTGSFENKSDDITTRVDIVKPKASSASKPASDPATSKPAD